MQNRFNRFANIELKGITTFAKGSDLDSCTKIYKLYIRLVDAGVKYDISVRMRTQLKFDTGYFKPTKMRTPNGTFITVNIIR